MEIFLDLGISKIYLELDEEKFNIFLELESVSDIIILIIFFLIEKENEVRMSSSGCLLRWFIMKYLD